MAHSLRRAGEQIGEHFGAEFYTIGQRHIDADFKFPKTGGARSRKPFYVASKDVVTNTVVAEGSEDPALYRSEIKLTQINFINGKDIEDGAFMDVRARVRYRQPLFAARMYKINNGNYKMIFLAAQKFVAEGQSAVFYNTEGEMLGGGVIVRTDP